MELTITDLNTGLSNENLLRIQQKTRRIFDKLCHRGSSIKVTLDDTDGPGGGKDKHCRVVVHAIGMPDVVITDNQTSVMSAVNTSLSRAKITLLRKVKRKQKNTPVWAEKPLDAELQKYMDL